MHHIPLGSDTICAIATAPGSAGIALIRISGSEAIGIVDQIFSSSELRTLERAKDRVAYFGKVIHEGKMLDEVLVTCFRAPHSYTGEDVVEISCHGSVYIQQALLEALTDNGCRMAAPGEYTQRAYLNGKMDLSRAEAVADLIASESVAQHRMALTQMRGGYSEEFIMLRERLLKLTSLMELELDFSEEDVAFADRMELLSLLDDILGKIERLTSSFRLGNAIKKGIPVAIVGSTNAGKSTLLNALLLEERAIVSDTHGTTRDTIEETLNIDGLLFRFIDTAGLRSTADNIEALGIERSYRKMDEAALVLLLLDASRLNEVSQQEALLQVCMRLGDKPLLVLLNKIDLLGEQAMSCENLIRPLLPEGAELLPISAKLDQGLGELRQALVASLALPEYTSADLIVSNARHYTLLKETSVALDRVRQGLVEGLPTDLVTPDLRHAIASLGEVTGTAITSDQVLHHIFAHFCIGK
jgi:tRNA modification GTPase trmE